MKIQGTVIDSGGKLQGATISKEVNGAFVGVTSTDKNGFFELEDGYKGRIKVSFIGYESQILDYAAGYIVELKESTTSIGEVTVTGTKTAKKAGINFNTILLIIAAIALAYIGYKNFYK